MCQLEHKQRKAMRALALNHVPSQLQQAINDLDQVCKRGHVQVTLLDKLFYVNTLHGSNRLPKHVCAVFNAAIQSPQSLTDAVLLMNMAAFGQSLAVADPVPILQ
jgi:hypothetical protein